MSLQVEIEKKLRDITLKVSFKTEENNGISGILGASGCGKSMTLKCIAGIEKPDRGHIIVNGRVLFDSEKGINRRVQERHVGYLFQNYALFPNMTVRQNIELVMNKKQPVMNKKQPGMALSASEYMRLLHIEDLADRYPSRLSGGQQQRVALARILASKPDVLMLDEPFSALDYYLKEKLQWELLDVLREYRGDVLMVTHSRDEIYRFCKNIHVLDQGKQVISGDTKEVFREPQVMAAAKLTGCKNIAAFHRLSKHKIEIPTWKNVVLTFEGEIPDDLKFIGIRAHYLRERTPEDKINIIKCSCTQILEDPFEVTLILDNGIWWKLPKKVWHDQFHCILPDEIVIPKESIMLLRET